MPWSGPRSLPLSSSWFARCASLIARSRVIVTTAPSFGPIVSSRRSASSASSTALNVRARSWALFLFFYWLDV